MVDQGFLEYNSICLFGPLHLYNSKFKERTSKNSYCLIQLRAHALLHQPDPQELRVTKQGPNLKLGHRIQNYEFNKNSLKMSMLRASLFTFFSI